MTTGLSEAQTRRGTADRGTADRGTAGVSGRGDLVQTVKSLPLPVLLYLLAVLIPSGLSVGPLVVTTLRALLLVLILPLLLQIFTGKHGKVRSTDILFMLYLVWMCISLALNTPDHVIEQTGSVGAEFIGGYALGRCHIRSEADYLALCRALVVAALILLPFAVLEAVTGNQILIRLLQAIPGNVTVASAGAEPRMGLERVQSVFAHPIHFGLFCSIVFAQVIVTMRGTISSTRRYVTGALIALEGFLSLSSGALLSIILQFGFILWYAIFSTNRRKWWLLVGLFCAAYLFVATFSNRPPIRVFMSYATFSPETAYFRSMIFDFGMDNVWANPFFGLGLKDWVRPEYMHTSSVDNFWLLTTMRYGIPAFLLLVAGYVWPMIGIMARRLAAGSIASQIRRAWIFTFFGLSFTLTTVHIWTNIYSFVFFMFGAGMWLLDVPEAAAAPAPGARPDRTSPDRTLPAAASRRANLGQAEAAPPAPEQPAPPTPGSNAIRYSRFPRNMRRVSPSEAASGAADVPKS